MVNNVEISNELIARYVDNQVSEYERVIVRQYLSENPDELESVLVMTTAMLLNDDEDSLPDDLFVGSNTLEIDSEIIYSAAAFAPLRSEKRLLDMDKKSDTQRDGSTYQRLTQMLEEIKGI